MVVGLLFSAIIAALTAVFIVIAREFNKKGMDLKRPYRIGALLMVGVAFVRYIYDQPAIYDLLGLVEPAVPSVNEGPILSAEPISPFIAVVMILLVWLGYAAMMTVATGEFFEFKTLRRIVNLFSVPVYLLITLFFGVYAQAIVGEAAFSAANPILWLAALEVSLALAIPISRVIVLKEMPSLPRERSDIINLIVATLMAIATAMPCYVPQALIGRVSADIKLYDFTEEHRFMIYFAIILPLIAFHVLKDKSDDVKRFLMTYFSLSQLWVYIGRWDVSMLADPLEWPLHLCNTAMFLVPLCLVFRMDKLFNFCLFINVLGALLAMMLPNEYATIGAIGTERVSYWVNHYSAFALPPLLVALKVFKRPKFREWVYSVVALTVYFVAMLFVNAWFSNYGECDYFFLNSDFIVSNLGLWAERTRDFTVSFNIGELSFTFYPLYQALFYVVYVGFTVGVWFLYALLFRMWDASEDRRLRERDYELMKKELNEFLGGRTIHEPIDGDYTPRLILRHFSKRYGSNKHYSVNDVSFEVKAGEVFGFLGPNGAGKSTIIKSMVGIQTITSGEIEICGFNVEKQPVQAKLHSGFVPDHYALYENLTGREYVNYIADLFQVSREDRDERIERLVERFQLVGSFDNQMKTYSHGMKQKITLMSALVHDPKVWILDEPLTGLDPTSIHEVKECMKEHAARGNIVFFSSHIIDIVEKICDRIAIIKKGQLRACVTLKELEEQGIELEQFYLDIINSGDDEHVPYTPTVSESEAQPV